MTSWESPFGFASRRLGSCAPGEEHCGATWNLTATGPLYHQCCPYESFCGKKDTGTCCRKEGQDCTDYIIDPAHCADQNWNLFQNPDGDEGRFCCERGKIGFTRRGNGVGCANEENITQTDKKVSPINSPSVIPTSTTSPTSPSTSTSNASAIAGGVVGGVAGLAIILALFWYFKRRSQKQPLQAESAQSDPTQLSGEPTELDGHPYRPNELDGQAYIELEDTPTYELPDNSKV